MAADRLAHRHCRFDLALHKFKAFQFHLTAAHIQRRDDLVIRRCRGMRHICFVKALLDLTLEILIVDMDHRPLPQRRQRLVGGLRGIDPDPRIGRRNQSRFDQGFVIRAFQLFLLFDIQRLMRLCPQPAAQVVGRAHPCALAVGRAEPGKGKPCLIPQEYQVRLDCQTFLHHPLDVIDQPVKGAVGQQQHPHTVQLARGL